MMTVNATAVEPLRRETILEVLRQDGPCISLFLKPYKQGEHSAPAQGILKTDIQEASRLLGDLKITEPMTGKLLTPLQELAKDPGLATGHKWARAIFSSPEGFSQFQLTEPVTCPVTVGGSIQIRPLLAQLHFPQEFHLLALSKKGVSLFHCSGTEAGKIALPAGVAATMEEMLALEPPDHDLENRKPAGSSIGAMKGVRFGTGKGRETQSAYLADYYKSVDRGMATFLHSHITPLVVVGVEQDVAIYQKVNTYVNLLPQAVQGSPDGFLEEEDMIRAAYGIVRADYVEREEINLREARERTTPTRFLADLHLILPAAFEGRVNRLYINEEARTAGVFERGHYRSWGPEDLLNLAAVETLRHGGDAISLPAKNMHYAVAAILRF